MAPTDNKLTPIDIDFTGKLVTSLDGTQIGLKNFKVLKNMRYTNSGIKGINGESKINSLGETEYPNFKNAFHYRKSTPSETHLLVQAANLNETTSKVIENKTVIPKVTGNGLFEGTALWTDGSGAGTGYFSDAPNNSLAYCNGVEAVIWGGEEYRCPVFLVEGTKSAADFSRDYTEEVNKNSTSEFAVLTPTSATVFYVGSVRPLSKVKFYVKTANAVASVMTASYWPGTGSWVTMTTTDGTASGGKTLAVSGLVSFSDAGLSKPTILANSSVNRSSVYAYWYKFTFSANPSSTTEIYYVTTYSPPTNIVDLWDGIPRSIMSMRRTRETNDTSNLAQGEFAVRVKDDSYIRASDPESPDDTFYYDPNTWASVTVKGKGDGGYILCGFSEKMTGIQFKFLPGKFNSTNNAAMNMYYWDGTAWTEVTGLVDGTARDAGGSFGKNGVAWWQSTSTNECKRSVSSGIQYYYYKITFDAPGLDIEVSAYYVSGIPIPQTVDGYAFPAFWQNRLVLCANQFKKNTVLVSGSFSESTWNGTDSCELEFGNGDPVTAACSIFSRYGSAMTQTLVVCKSNETWLVDGTGPEDYKLYQVSKQYGCVSPKTMRVCDIGYEVSIGNTRQVAIWQSNCGIVMFDGNTIQPISHDIANYFDPVKTECINPSYIDKSAAFYDYEKSEYHFLFVSGTSSTGVLNKELVYDIVRQKWFEIVRHDALQGGCQAMSTIGKHYTYGLQTYLSNGYLVRLENGTVWSSANGITYQVTTGDGTIPESFLYETEIRGLRLSGVAKNTTTATVAVTHYADTKTASTTPAIPAISMASSTARMFNVYRSLSLGGVYHCLDFQVTTNNETIGFEPLRLGIFTKTIREDLT